MLFALKLVSPAYQVADIQETNMEFMNYATTYSLLCKVG